MKKMTISSAILAAMTATTGAVASPALNLSLEDMTLSGLSSGGYMATQFHLAHSDKISGVGIIGAGPYFCAQGDIQKALARCVSKASDDLPTSAMMNQAAQYAESADLAPLENLKDDRVWIFHGTADETVNHKAAEALVMQYQQWVSTENVTFVSDKVMSHHFPTENKGTNCLTSESPFIGNCDFDAAGEIFNHLYTTPAPRSEMLSGTLHTIDQQALGGEPADSLAKHGYLYVPADCEQGECRVHISFHGCNQNAEAIGDQYAQQVGLNEWADSNNTVVLYPQTQKSMFMPLNPQACWDWWGYTGDNYATKGAMQITAVMNMVNALNTTQASGE